MSKSFCITALIATTQAAFVPKWEDSTKQGTQVEYSAIEMPSDNMPEEQTRGLFTGKFWVDGFTQLTMEDDIYYQWVFATVHAPQLPISSELTLFGQIDKNIV